MRSGFSVNRASVLLPEYCAVVYWMSVSSSSTWDGEEAPSRSQLSVARAMSGVPDSESQRGLGVLVCGRLRSGMR